MVTGTKVIYTHTAARSAPAGWIGKVGRVTPEISRAEVPDCAKCQFYISGPSAIPKNDKLIACI
jgi:hypothetical protein